ncbi:MAG: SLC13 family permease [Luteolibacter sp.]
MNDAAMNHGQWIRRAGLIAGPLLALLCYFLLPERYAADGGNMIEFTHQGRATLAMMLWMAAWWMTEAVDVEVTALLPIALFPVFGIASIAEATKPYASDVIYLFMGGFVLGLAIQRWGLDRRLAFFTLRLTGAKPSMMSAGLMAAAAFLSMWISNTACAAIMVPIAISVINLVLHTRNGRCIGENGDMDAFDQTERNYATGLLLGIAYAASIGGIATLIGSAPNGIAARFLEQTYQQEVTFVKWLTIGLPFTIIFLPLAWWLITRVIFPAPLEEIPGGRKMLAEEYEKLGPLSHGEKVTLTVFACTAMLWIFGGLLRDVSIAGMQPLKGLSDSGVAVLAAISLFLLPADRMGNRVMDWQTAAHLPWGVLILFGGGLSLATAVEANGVSQFIGHSTRGLGILPPFLMLAAVVTLTVFLSEFTSNTAQVATMTPVLAAMAPALGMNPQVLVVVCALSASSAYIMPVGTPPNAIVFSTGLIRMPQMIRAGILLNLAGIVLITILGWIYIPKWF